MKLSSPNRPYQSACLDCRPLQRVLHLVAVQEPGSLSECPLRVWVCHRLDRRKDWAIQEIPQPHPIPRILRLPVDECVTRFLLCLMMGVVWSGPVNCNAPLTMRS